MLDSHIKNPRRTAAEAEQEDVEESHDELKKSAGDGRHRSLYRSDHAIREHRPACRVVSGGNATVGCTIRPTRVDVSTRRDHLR